MNNWRFSIAVDVLQGPSLLESALFKIGFVDRQAEIRQHLSQRDMQLVNVA